MCGMMASCKLLTGEINSSLFLDKWDTYGYNSSVSHLNEETLWPQSLFKSATSLSVPWEIWSTFYHRIYFHSISLSDRQVTDISHSIKQRGLPYKALKLGESFQSTQTINWVSNRHTWLLTLPPWQPLHSLLHPRPALRQNRIAIPGLPPPGPCLHEIALIPFKFSWSGREYFSYISPLLSKPSPLNCLLVVSSIETDDPLSQLYTVMLMELDVE